MTHEAITSVTAAAQLVPASYAEKAMASLMQLHTELMDEKERRVDLFKKLMEREQALAELKMYVKVLEERLTPPAPPPMPVPVMVAPVQQAAPRPVVVPISMAPPRPPATPPVPPRIVQRAHVDGWKTW
ncbi:MAG: hypothetical protein QM817_11600 [Archangium sp.]